MTGGTEIDKDGLAKILDDLKRSGRKARKMWQVLYDFGCRYAASADHIMSLVSQDPDFTAPMLMCRFFSIELLLKFFLVIDHRSVSNKTDLKVVGVNLRGHDYTPLFDEIQPEYRRAIAEWFSTISAKPTSEMEFRNLLAQFEKGFIKWRYIYEEEQVQFIDGRDLYNINGALGKCAEAEARRRGHIKSP